MLYAILIYDVESANPSSEPPPPEVAQGVMTEYNAYTKSLRDSGAFQAGEALQPAPTATTIRQQDGRNVTTDGPFAETKEALGGFYIVEARDLDEALGPRRPVPRTRSTARRSRSGRWSTIRPSPRPRQPPARPPSGH